MRVGKSCNEDVSSQNLDEPNGKLNYSLHLCTKIQFECQRIVYFLVLPLCVLSSDYLCLQTFGLSMY